MSESPEPSQPCARCGELGCEPAMHPDAGSELAMTATTGGLLGASLVGLLGLPYWLRRFEEPEVPAGHPRQRLLQDRKATAVLGALAMATLTLSALTVAAMEHYGGATVTAFAGPTGEVARADSEIDEVLHLIEHGSPAQAVVGMDQLLELAPELNAEEATKVAATHERVGPAAGFDHERSRSLREALRRSDRREAAEGLAAAYRHVEDPAERGQTLVALGRCASPEALGQVLEAETERYRTHEIAHLINVGCVGEVAHELFALADAHPVERPGVYRALSEACDFRPHTMRDLAGAAIAERWLALSRRGGGEQAAPSTKFLAHALACASDELLDEALMTMPAEADEWARAEVAIASYRRGRIELETLFQRATEDKALRRQLDEHYEGTAPWNEPPPDPRLVHQRQLEGLIRLIEEHETRGEAYDMEQLQEMAEQAREAREEATR